MEPIFIGGTCASCDCLLMHGLYGEEVVQFPCGHEVHKTCLYDDSDDEAEDDEEEGETPCPICEEPSSPDSSSDGSISDLGDITKEAPDETQVIPLELSSDDAVIAVLGPKGAGKSFFVRAATGDESIEVSKTSQHGPDQFSAHRIELDGQPLVLVDSFGFNDTHQSHMDVLRTLSIWLAEMDLKNVRLAGVIYMHDVGSSESFIASEKNLRVLRKILGESAPKKVVFLTNFLDESDSSSEDDSDEDGISTSTEASKEHFGISREGITMENFNGTTEDACRILKSVIAEHAGTVISQQQDLVAGKIESVEQTASDWMRNESEMTQLRSDFEYLLKSIRTEISERKVQQRWWLEEQLEARRDEQLDSLPEEQTEQLSEPESLYEDVEQYPSVAEGELERTEQQVDNEALDSSNAPLSSIKKHLQISNPSQPTPNPTIPDPISNNQHSSWTLLIQLWEILQRIPSISVPLPITSTNSDQDPDRHLYLPCSFDPSPEIDVTLSDDLHPSSSADNNEPWSPRLTWRLRPGIARIASEGDLYIKQNPDWFLFVVLMFFYLFLNGLVLGVYLWRRKGDGFGVGGFGIGSDIRLW